MIVLFDWYRMDCIGRVFGIHCCLRECLNDMSMTEHAPLPWIFERGNTQILIRFQGITRTVQSSGTQ